MPPLVLLWGRFCRIVPTSNPRRPFSRAFLLNFYGFLPTNIPASGLILALGKKKSENFLKNICISFGYSKNGCIFAFEINNDFTHRGGSRNKIHTVMENRDFVYKMVTDKVIENLAKGRVMWQKPWHLAGNEEEVAISYVTRKPYSLINQWLLMEPGEYLTFNQIKSLGGNIKKGAKSRFVVFFTHVPYVKKNEKTGEEQTLTYPLLKYYNVFHINDTEGVKSKIKRTEAGEIKATPQPMCDEADAAIASYVEMEDTLRFINDCMSDRAYYSPSEDKVVVPMRKQFDVMEEYYSTAFHELTHSTLIEKRCNRRETGKPAFFGSKEYSREELVAEMGAAMLCSNFGLDSEKAFRNSIGYLQSWIEPLKNDPKAIVVAAGKAEKAVRYILGERN